MLHKGGCAPLVEVAPPLVDTPLYLLLPVSFIVVYLDRQEFNNPSKSCTITNLHMREEALVGCLRDANEGGAYLQPCKPSSI